MMGLHHRPHNQLKVDNRHGLLIRERLEHRKGVIEEWERLNESTKEISDIKICFYNNDASERGVTNSMYDYADYSEIMLKMKVEVIFPRIIEHDSPLLTHATSDAVGVGSRISLPRFTRRFPVSFCGEPLTEELRQRITNISFLDPPYQFCPELSSEALARGCQVLYIQKGGAKQHIPSYPISFRGSIPTLVHAVFNWDPHGTVYSAISPSIKGYNSRARGNVLPYIVTPQPRRIAELTPGLRRRLGIPPGARVVCRHGSSRTFDIWYVKSAIISLLEKYNSSQLHFLFLDTSTFERELDVLGDVFEQHGSINKTIADELFGGIGVTLQGVSNVEILGKFLAQKYGNPSRYSSGNTNNNSNNSNSNSNSNSNNGELSALRAWRQLRQQVHFLNVTTSDEAKEQFFKTCDAMLHARSDGETFGLAVAEMSIRNKPVITQGRVRRYADMHLRALGDKGYYYLTHSEVVALVSKFVDQGVPKDVDYNCYKDFYPHIVMKKFKEMFIDPILSHIKNVSIIDLHKTIW